MGEQLYKHAHAQVRKAQIGTGDRDVYVNKDGERMSRLREVDSDWIIRRLERWGKRVRRMEPHLPHFLWCLIRPDTQGGPLSWPHLLTKSTPLPGLPSTSGPANYHVIRWLCA